jgi:hypothetical protein
MKEDEVHGQCDNSLLIEVVKSVAVLTSKFDSFEKVRSEDNMELKESVNKVDSMQEKIATVKVLVHHKTKFLSVLVNNLT